MPTSSNTDIAIGAHSVIHTPAPPQPAPRLLALPLPPLVPARGRRAGRGTAMAEDSW